MAAATIVPRHVLGGPGHVAPSDRVNLAVVGVGGRGFQNTKELLQLDDVRVVAIADPAEKWDLSGFYYRGVAGRLSVVDAVEKHYQLNHRKFKCKQFVDYREMIAEQASEFDAVLCATPDHLHASVSLAALRAGKHVYCEKPLTHNIAEARLVARVAKESGLATQIGNQGHSTDDIRVTCELVRSGAIGEITEVHAWVPATYTKTSTDRASTGSRRTGLGFVVWPANTDPVSLRLCADGLASLLETWLWRDGRFRLPRSRLGRLGIGTRPSAHDRNASGRR